MNFLEADISEKYLSFEADDAFLFCMYNDPSTLFKTELVPSFRWNKTEANVRLQPLPQISLPLEIITNVSSISTYVQISFAFYLSILLIYLHPLRIYFARPVMADLSSTRFGYLLGRLGMATRLLLLE